MDVEALGTRLLAALKGHVARALAPTDSRVAALEARVQALEARPELKYCGVWTEGEAYGEGDFVTHGGSMWHCYTPTKERPGTTDAWQLAVKRGKDAR